jgi:hypothetical protein
MPPCTNPQRPAFAGHAAHAVVHQDVGRAGGTRAAVRADHAIGRERDFDLGRFEPFVEQVGGALREDLHEAGNLARAQLAEAASSFRYSTKSPGFFGGSSGGVTSSSDSTTTRERSRYASYFGNAFGIARGELRDFGSVFFRPAKRRDGGRRGKTEKKAGSLG